jgi:uncharacterized protein with FMN-binding domain
VGRAGVWPPLLQASYVPTLGAVSPQAYAIPALDNKALAADSTHIDTVSGATHTSAGYVASLQSALDKAGV